MSVSVGCAALLAFVPVPSLRFSCGGGGDSARPLSGRLKACPCPLNEAASSEPEFVTRMKGIELRCKSGPCHAHVRVAAARDVKTTDTMVKLICKSSLQKSLKFNSLHSHLMTNGPPESPVKKRRILKGHDEFSGHVSTGVKDG